MNENEAYGEYVVARAEAWTIHDTLVTSGQIASIEDLNANEEYQAAVEKEHNAWVHYLSLRKA